MTERTTTTARTGRLSLRMTEDFINLCKTTADARGLTLTEFTQQSLLLNITRKPLTMAELEQMIVKAAHNG